MLNKKDKLIKLLLNSPHVCDFIYEREDGTYYAFRKNKDEWYQELTKVGDQWITGEVIKTKSENI